jgi:hypothetical protein
MEDGAQGNPWSMLPPDEELAPRCSRGGGRAAHQARGRGKGNRDEFGRET